MDDAAPKGLNDQIRTHRNRLGLTQEQVAERLGIPRSAVSDIESGKRDVSAAELVGLGRLFGQSLDVLLGVQESRPRDDEGLMFRASAVSAEGRAQLDRWRRHCEAYRRLETDLGEEPLADIRPVLAILSAFEQAEELADEERARLGLGQTPAHTLLAVVEDRLRVKVAFLALGGDISGASVVSPTFGPAILINRNHTPGRRVFTLAHELFHLLSRGPAARGGQPTAWHVCDAQQVGTKKDRVEQLADRFAGRLLVPRDHFVERLRLMVGPGRVADQTDLIAVARYFGVSVQAVFVQLAVLRLATWDQAMSGYKDPVTQEGILQAGAEVGPEPQRFTRLAVKAYLAEKVSRGRLAELLEVNVADVDDVLRRYGGGGTDRGISIALPR